MADDMEEVQRHMTETHRLIKNKDWNAVKERLACDEGREEAKTKDEQGRLIFHLEELYDVDVPIETIRAANDANKVGFVTKNDRGVHPMLLAIRKSRPQVVALLLQLHPKAAKEKLHNKSHRHLLHHACEAGQSTTVQLLLSSYPAAASVGGPYGDYPLLLSRKCSFETQLSLLVAHPDLAKQKIHGRRLFHHALRFFDNYSISNHILQLYPEAATERSAYGELPIHCAMRNSRVFSIKELNLLTRGNSNVLAEVDNFGRLPLHGLCCSVSDGDDFKDAHLSQMMLFREVYRQLPDAALHADNDNYLPFDWLLIGARDKGEDFNISNENTMSSFVEIWCSLVAAAPHSLQRRHLRESPFITLSKLCPPPTKVWDNAVTYYPAALRSLDRKNEVSSLSISLTKRMPEELLDSSSYSYSILKSTFKCLRTWHCCEEESTQHIIVEDIPPMHMILYCYHLLQYKTLCQYVLPSPKNQALRRLFSEKDSNLNTVLHILCHAPCPKEKNDPETDEEDEEEDDEDDEDDEYEVKEKEEPSIVQDFINLGYTYRNDSHMSSAANIFGDLPVHLLLRNRQPLFHEFNTVVGILMDWNESAAVVADSKERLYPFMLAASNLAKREDKEDVCSLTYTLLLQFVALNDLTEFCSAHDE